MVLQEGDVDIVIKVLVKCGTGFFEEGEGDGQAGGAITIGAREEMEASMIVVV